LGKLWHIELEGQPIGYLLLTSGFILEFGGRQYILDELYVRPNFRRRGFGTRAIQFAESVCREDGIRVLRLEVDQTSTRTISLYRKVGFRLQHRHTMTRLLH
jgi:ribosomal protein S18 acetylase RimI-like enzyme